jgi:hypothetical protein
MDMFIVFTGGAPIAQDTIRHQLNEDQDNIEFLETPTECRSNDGAIAETVPEEE